MNTKRILCTGKIVAGPIDWKIAPLPVGGELQRMIDEGEAASTRFGDMLRAMIGDDDDRHDGSIEDDHDWIREGC